MIEFFDRMPRNADFRFQLNNDDHEKVEAALDFSLKALGVPYIDLWLMHCEYHKCSFPWGKIF